MIATENLTSEVIPFLNFKKIILFCILLTAYLILINNLLREMLYSHFKGLRADKNNDLIRFPNTQTVFLLHHGFLQ